MRPQFLYRAVVAARGGEGRGSAGSPLVTMTPGHPRPDPQAPGNHITAGSCSQNWIEEFKMFFFPKLPGSEGWGGEGGWGGQSNAVFKDVQLFFGEERETPKTAVCVVFKEKTSRAEATRQTMWPFIHRAAPRAPSIGSVRFSFAPPPPALWSFGMGGGQTGGSFTRPGRLKRARESGRHTPPRPSRGRNPPAGSRTRAARKKSNLAEKKAGNLRARRAELS